MWTLMLEGGYPMWFLLVFGLAALGAAGVFALRPERRRLRLALALAATTLFSTLTGVASDIAAVGHGAPAYWAAHPNESLAEVLLTGLAESMSPATLGFSLLAVVALLVAVGLFRMDADEVGAT